MRTGNGGCRVGWTFERRLVDPASHLFWFFPSAISSCSHLTPGNSCARLCAVFRFGRRLRDTLQQTTIVLPRNKQKTTKKTNSSNSISTIAGWATAPCPCTILAEHSPCNAHRICRGKTNRNAQDRWTKRTARDTHTETPTHSSMHFFHLPLTEQSISSCFCCC